MSATAITSVRSAYTTACRRNEAFYLGRQWEGLRVQSLDPLIFNVLRRCVNLFVSMLVSDDVAVRAQPFDMDGDGRQNRPRARACVRVRDRTLGCESPRPPAAQKTPA